jgi:hypothetical protein
MPERHDISGQRFGWLTAVRHAGTTADRRALWECVCDCGEEIVAQLGNLRAGATRSCGCLRKEVAAKRMTTHGETAAGRKNHSPEYRAWCLMKGRCLSPTNPNFADYGGRGIGVAPRWANSFEAFLADMGRRPTDKHTLDRIDVNGPYAPGNCRWATRQEQSRNRRNVTALIIAGKTRPIWEWAAEANVNVETLRSRLAAGVSPDVAVRLRRHERVAHHDQKPV